MQLPIHSYQRATASNARLVNCFAEANPVDGKAPHILKRANGISTFASPGTGPGRGLVVIAGVLYALSGTTLYRIESTGTYSVVGHVPGFGRAFMAANVSQALISTDGVAYAYSGGSVSAISDPDIADRNVGAVAFLDGFILGVDRGTGQFFGSAFNDATNFDGLDFATAEAAPDNLVTLAVDHRQAVLIGETTTEIWYNSGGSGFPFERTPNGVLEIGGAAEHGVAKSDNSVLWLANDRTIRRLSGATPQRISQHGVEEALRKYARVDDCEAFSFSQEGHLFTAFRFPSAGACWVYDATVSEWHERESYQSTDWKVTDAVQCYGKTFVQNAATGYVGVVDAGTLTEWGQTQTASWTYQSIYNNGQRLPHGSIELGVEVGVAPLNGQGSDPLLTLEVSNDGGKTFQALPLRSLGKTGQYRKRVRWEQLGMAVDRVYRASIADPVPLTVWDTVLTLG